MNIIGVTGISGSGKTTITHMLAQMGGYTVDADQLVHQLMQKGQPLYNDIIAVYGTDILDNKGEIYRPALGKLVFNDKEKLAQLESIIHPQVIATTNSLITQAKSSGQYKFAVIDAPLLIEAGMHKDCHSCWLVTASHEKRLARIMARDNISKEAAEKRLANRASDSALMPHANIIIENNDDDLTALKEQVINVFKHVNLV